MKFQQKSEVEKQFPGVSTSALDQALGEAKKWKNSRRLSGRMAAVQEKALRAGLSHIFWLPVKLQGDESRQCPPPTDPAAWSRLFSDTCISPMSPGLVFPGSLCTTGTHSTFAQNALMLIRHMVSCLCGSNTYCFNETYWRYPALCLFFCLVVGVFSIHVTFALVKPMFNA